MCVVIPFILDDRLADVPAGVTQDFSTFLLQCLPYFFSRGFSLFFPSSTVQSIFLFLFLCVCFFLKLHITAQSGPVFLVIVCHSH